MTLIYKVTSEELWREAKAAGVFAGAPVDLADGFIHFSTGDQLAETLRRHFAGVDGLVLIAFEDSTLGPELRYEPSRGGDLFPHLYRSLNPGLALWVKPLPLAANGKKHVLPDLSA